MNYEIPIATRVMLFFARSPDEELTTSDLAEKFAVPTSVVANALRHRRDCGLLRSRYTKDADLNRQMVWSAGPLLLRECGIEEAA